MGDVPPFKLIILGDVGVGKTSVVNCHLGKMFQVEVCATLGVHHLKEILQRLAADFATIMNNIASQ
jgi:GTPase SAR1 family protein